MSENQFTEAYEWRGRDVVGSDGEKIGTVDEIYLDTTTGDPEWLSINTGLFEIGRASCRERV